MPTIFISHAKEDREFVDGELVSLINALGFESWYAKTAIQSAEHWERSILAGLQASEWFMIIMSPSSAMSEWVKDEVNWAMEERVGRIIPLLIAECNPRDIHIRLPRIQHIDFGGNQKEAREELIRLLIDYNYTPSRVVSAINGNWSGSVQQDEGPDGVPMECRLEANMSVNRGAICGEMYFHMPYQGKTITQSFTVTGKFIFDRYLQLNYVSKDEGAVQFGSIVGELSATGKSARGRFVGYGAWSEKIITGSAELEKTA